MTHQQINLYHPIFRREQKLFSAGTMVRAWLALLAVALLVTGFDAWQTRDLAQALRSATQNQQAALARLTSAYSVFGVGRARAELATLTRREKALRRLSQFLRESHRAQVGPAPVLLAVSASVVPGLWVTHFSLDRKQKALVLGGHSERPSFVPLFLHRLVSQSTLSGYRFHGLTITRVKIHHRYKPYVDFAATTVVAATPGAAGGHAQAHGSRGGAHGH
ncbi:MAG: hypothetical protein ACYDEV_08395 [Acidiferrobacter sp.]